MNLHNTQHNQKTQRTIYLVEEQYNPSSDFFVLPALMLNKQARIIRCGFKQLPSAEALIDATVIFVRYICAAWVKLIEKVRPHLHKLIFFIDDDVFSVAASAGMSLRYRFKLANLAARHYGWLQKQAAQLWVSTPYLYNKYSHLQPRLVLPAPVGRPKSVCCLFYHGTASHNAEIRWLRPVIEQVLARNNGIAFEIVGGDDVYKLYRGLDRVTVIHPMKWSAYQCFLNAEQRHIGLAPLLNTPFNKARSYAKFFGIHSCGAVGIYSENGIFSQIVQHGINGLVISMQQEAWVEAILHLVDNETLRNTLYFNANITYNELAQKAEQSYLGLLDD